MDLAIKLSLVAICVFILWRTYSMCRAHPELFTKASFAKSLTTIGILALVLIVLIALMVLSLKTG